MKYILTFLATLVAPAAVADPGHLAGVAGHEHWVAGIALGVAIGLAAWGALKGKDQTAVGDESHEELQEA